MAKTRDNYQITGQTVEELVRNLNFLLQRLADRMDKIEGIRGTSSIEGDVAAQNLIVSGDVTVNDADGETLHSLE